MNAHRLLRSGELQQHHYRNIGRFTVECYGDPTRTLAPCTSGGASRAPKGQTTPQSEFLAGVEYALAKGREVRAKSPAGATEAGGELSRKELRTVLERKARAGNLTAIRLLLRDLEQSEEAGAGGAPLEPSDAFAQVEELAAARREREEK